MVKKNKKNNIIKFPDKLSKLERKIEAILFAASEPLELETIEKRIETKNNVENILKKMQDDYKNRGINLVCIRKKWSFRKLGPCKNFSATKIYPEETVEGNYRNVIYNCLSSTSNKIRN